MGGDAPDELLPSAVVTVVGATDGVCTGAAEGTMPPIELATAVVTASCAELARGFLDSGLPDSSSSPKFVKFENINW